MLVYSVSAKVLPIRTTKPLGTMGSRWELRHLAGSPGGGGGVLGSVIL
jgi:hypothetical protein